MDNTSPKGYFLLILQKKYSLSIQEVSIYAARDKSLYI